MSSPTLGHDLSPVLHFVHQLADCLRHIVTLRSTLSLKARVLTSLDGTIWIDGFP